MLLAQASRAGLGRLVRYTYIFSTVHPLCLTLLTSVQLAQHPCKHLCLQLDFSKVPRTCCISVEAIPCSSPRSCNGWSR